MKELDREILLFEELKKKYSPIQGFHLLLDLDAYKQGVEILTQYSYDSDEYFKTVNIDYNEKEKEKVIITSNKRNSISMTSKILYIWFDLDKNQIIEFRDLTPNPFKLKRTLKQETDLLIYELQNPQPRKPAC